jgi:hypothetical protein
LTRVKAIDVRAYDTQKFDPTQVDELYIVSESTTYLIYSFVELYDAKLENVWLDVHNSISQLHKYLLGECIQNLPKIDAFIWASFLYEVKLGSAVLPLRLKLVQIGNGKIGVSPAEFDIFSEKILRLL